MGNSQQRLKKIGPFTSKILDNLWGQFENEYNHDYMKTKVLDPIITHVIVRLQPWIIFTMIIFALFFILVISFMIYIIKNT